MRRPSVSPGPRKLLSDVRLALSYDALKIQGRFILRAAAPMASAILSAWASLSITHGPAIKKNDESPMATESTLNWRVVISEKAYMISCHAADCPWAL